MRLVCSLVWFGWRGSCPGCEGGFDAGVQLHAADGAGDEAAECGLCYGVADLLGDGGHAPGGDWGGLRYVAFDPALLDGEQDQANTHAGEVVGHQIALLMNSETALRISLERSLSCNLAT